MDVGWRTYVSLRTRGAFTEAKGKKKRFGEPTSHGIPKRSAIQVLTDLSTYCAHCVALTSDRTIGIGILRNWYSQYRFSVSVSIYK